ncbi:MAG: HAMP domain-containing histidine kinase [Alphaproteobacteria bacterium]|nr:HAMP domain-containing histidine kinase [Alphaproteobacteria bacterium]
MVRRPSALLVLGVYAGVIAAMAILPAALPLLYRLVWAEVRASQAEFYTKTARIGQALDKGSPLPRSVGVRYLKAVRTDGTTLHRSGQLEPEAFLEDHVCGEPSGVMGAVVQNVPLTAVCYENPQLRVFALWDAPSRSYMGIGAFVVALATVAGLVTALGVLQVLRPLSKMNTALSEVGLGRRGVRMAYTGIHEIDELISRLNQTATAVEEREYAILARVSVVQEMARLVAHEIRNPLQSLELLTSLVAEEADQHERRQLAASIHTEIQALDDVVTRLLREGATRGALRLQARPCNIAELLQHIRSVRSAEAQRKGANLALSMAFEGTVPLDRALFSRSVENLVANALRAVPSGTGVVRISTATDGDHLVLTVDDNGPGVDPALGDRVFEPNVSGEAGTGLGLALTKGVVEAHGGTVQFSSSDLGGARFQVRVPLHAISGPAR